MVVAVVRALLSAIALAGFALAAYGVYDWNRVAADMADAPTILAPIAYQMRFDAIVEMAGGATAGLIASLTALGLEFQAGIRG